jgi:hypothetical protein
MIFIKGFLQQLCAILGTGPTHTSTHNISKTQLKISCRFYRITDLGLLHFYFSSKNYSSKIYTPLEKVVVYVTLRITKLGLLFLDFLQFLIDFTSYRRRRRGARARRSPAGFIAQLEAVEAMAWAPSRG